MTEQEFLDLLTQKGAQEVLDRLADLPPKDRRAHAKPALDLFKALDRIWLDDKANPALDVKDAESATVAMVATASGSELKRLSFFPWHRKVPLEEVIGKLKPDWTQDVVDHFVEKDVLHVGMFRPLWEAGLCTRPDSDAIILDYYRLFGDYTDEEQERLLRDDVWRFFEVEGGGEFSLANHDKYLKSFQETWADRLKRYSQEGKLDRQRLLDASLDALDRDFAQYRAGWYSRFHVLMAPDTAEMTARSDRYLRLLASSIPPTVSFALKHVQALEKAGVLAAHDLLSALEPPLQARPKGTVTQALKLLMGVAKRDASLREDAARKAVLALISEDADVQEKALECIETLGADLVTAELSAYVGLLAPSLQPRIAALAGVSTDATPEPDLEVALSPVEPVLPVSSAEDALALFLSVLEEPRDPFDVERAVDGISRFGAGLRTDAVTLSPLLKRAKQVCKSPGDSEIRLVLAVTGWAFAEGIDPASLLSQELKNPHGYPLVPELSVQEFHLARNSAVLARVAQGISLPLLALPSDSGGVVKPDDLLARMAQFREADVDPDPQDLALALMRLGSEGRNAANLPLEREADRAVAYAMGADVKVGPTPELWAAAWRARGSAQPDKSIAKLFSQPVPGCGVPAAMELVVEKETSKDGEYSWINVQVPVTPYNQTKSRALPGLFGIPSKKYFDAASCGRSFADIAWASLVHPADPEAFFRIGLLHQDTWQKLSDNHTRAYLEPFFRPGPAAGPLGAAVLAYFMACEDKSVTALAVEATVGLSAEGRLTALQFAKALKTFLMSETLPTSRWTKGLKGVADLGAGVFARKVIVGVLDFDQTEMPRDIGGMLELCFELHVAQSAQLQDASAIRCLEAIEGGGKAARFAKKLLARAA